MPIKKESITYIINSNNYLKCPYCNEHFVANNYKQIYCSREHKEKQQAFDRKQQRRKHTKKNKDRLSNKFNKLVKSPIGFYLSSQIKRSGTVEILRGFTSDTLKELHRLKSKATSFSGFMDGESLQDYHLSHIFSVKGNSNSIGTIHPENLVITPATWNLKHKSIATDGTGRSILISSLKNKWTVKNSDSPAEVLGKARAYLGREFNKFLSGVQLASQREQLVKKLKPLTSVSTNANLSELKSIAMLHGVKTFNKTSRAARTSEVLKHELERLNKTNHWTYWMICQLHYEYSFEADVFARKESDTPISHEAFVIEQTLNWLHECNVDIVFDGKPAPDYYAIPIHLKEKITLLEDELSPLDSFCIDMHRYKNSAKLMQPTFSQF